MKPPDPDEDNQPAVRRKKVPKVRFHRCKGKVSLSCYVADNQGPGMGVTYIYEPNGTGGVVQAGVMPVQAPSHRLMTSTDTRYAS